MNSKSILFHLFFLILFCAIYHDQVSSWEIQENLSTKTPYYPQQDASTYTPAPEGCTPVHIEYLARHGSREPTSSNVAQMQTLSKTLQAHSTYITNPDYAWMKTWVSPYQKAQAGLLLIPTGANEHYYTAKRMLENYPSVVLATNYTPVDYFFQSTQVSRTGQSGSAFIYGLFEDRGDIGPGNFMPFYIFANSTSTDLELRFFDNCPNYISESLDNPASNTQAQLFINETWLPIAIEVSMQIGSYPSWVIDQPTLSSMWTACTFDIVIGNTTSQFCSLFNQTTVDIFNYALDLDYYYVRGPGNPVNYQPATLLLYDMYTGLNCFVQCNSGTTCPSSCGSYAITSKLRFGHAETTMPFVSLLGLFNDSQPLMADWTPEQIANRQWVTSTIVPFAANDNFVLYECPADTYYVKYLHNEKEYVLPGCTGVYCEFSMFSAALAPALSLNYDAVCNYTSCEPLITIHENTHNCNITIAAVATGLSLLIIILLVLILALNYSKISKLCGCGGSHSNKYQIIQSDL